MLVDVSMPIKPGAVFRLGAPPVEITTQKFYHEVEGEYEAIVLSFPVHTATHIDLVVKDRHVALERMMGVGKLLDVTAIPEDQIYLRDLSPQVSIEAGDFVFFRTDWSKFAGTEKYYDHPELSAEVVEWLATKKINAVGIDALGLGRGQRHGERDRFLAAHDIFVIENLTGLFRITQAKFKVYCFPLRLEQVDAIPARVLVEING